MYEHRKQTPISRKLFVRRLFKQSLWATALLSASLGVGIVGYVTLEHLPWIDAFLNAAMLLGGMGPVNPPQSFGGKLFAGLYALYAGLVFIVTAALLFTPVLHRLLHRFHWDQAQ
jgi:sterol desaturase/sphingolipid hydroxylase (fatty acid hydroxylase superfamily)